MELKRGVGGRGLALGLGVMGLGLGVMGLGLVVLVLDLIIIKDQGP